MEWLNSLFENIKNKLKISSNISTSTIKQILKTKIFSFKPVTDYPLRDYINELNNTPSLDWYNLNAKLFHTITDIILYTLTGIINQCFQEGVYPYPLKIAKIPLPKNNSIKEPNDLRLFQILSVEGNLFDLEISNC